jgi:hypothetical protein
MLVRSMLPPLLLLLLFVIARHIPPRTCVVDDALPEDE